MGDAAHRIHPLAGQGVNVGFQDIAVFVEVIKQSEQVGRRFDAPTTLRRYERWRKAETMPMIAGIDSIKNIFSSQRTSLTTLRGLGLQFTQQCQWLRNLFVRHAV